MRVHNQGMRFFFEGGDFRSVFRAHNDTQVQDHPLAAPAGRFRARPELDSHWPFESMLRELPNSDNDAEDYAFQ